ncbi:MAG TPA: diguanylate cyclase, partial [Methylomirabilota bacterium]|nr:diguanylate cyclase [Methylomirabilota bacterium]
MKRPGVWVGRGLAVLGLAAVVPAVLQASVWALLAAVGGFLAATGLALAPLVRIWLAEQPVSRPSDVEHAIDLLRRAYGARAGWIVGSHEREIEVMGRDDVDGDARRRGASIVKLASVDSRAHVAREPEGSYVAVGDFPFGAGLLLAQPDAAPALAEAVVEELRRLVATMRLAEPHEPGEAPGQLVARELAKIAGGAKTLDGIAKAGVEVAQQFAQRGAAVVLPGVGAAAGAARVVAVSSAADSRLAGVTLPAGAAALRALQLAVPVATQGAEDIFGNALPDRRRQDRAGTAYPIFDGHFVVGVLVLMGPPIAAGTPVAEQIQRLVTELGSRLAAARAVYEAEQRAVRDHLTGLRSRREFERALALHEATRPPAIATLVYADIDHFKRLNDTLGHAAGDAA